MMEVKVLVSLENISSDEICVVTNYPLRRNRYRYSVTLLGGPYDGLEILCSTEQSACWLREQVLAARYDHRPWNWLGGSKSYDSTQRIASHSAPPVVHAHEQASQTVRTVSQGLPVRLRTGES